MTDNEIQLFKALLEWRMCSDPFPLSDDKLKLITDFLNEVSVLEYRCKDWIDAYHKL